jgi:DNA mismatch endonuclease (patch repair protein)
VLRRFSAVVFVHGCFWHQHSGCRLATLPKTRVAFWAQKLGNNRRRDRQQVRSLLNANWRVLIVWECALRKQAVRIQSVASAAGWIRDTKSFAEISARLR